MHERGWFALVHINEAIRKAANIELARRDFFHYCVVKDSKFFKYEREYQKVLASALQEFSDSEDDVLIVNVPP